MKKEATPNTQGAKKKDTRWKNRQLQTRKGLKKRHLMKKEATPKMQGAKKKNLDKKRGNPKHARG
jgi:hypothetical protein